MELIDTIYIPKSTEKYGFLNPFSKVEDGFTVNGLVYNSAEHYFQSKKFEFTDSSFSEEVRKAKDSNLANRLGTSKNGILRPDWDAVKCDIMYEANWEKFSQKEDLKKMLLETEDKKISQLSRNEFFWSVSSEGYGNDLLGKILMKVRENLKKNN